MQVVFKKLSKKDSVTVLKAIDELKAVFEKLEEKDYEPMINRYAKFNLTPDQQFLITNYCSTKLLAKILMLIFRWAREFESLVEVSDWKVREAALKLHKVLVTKIGRYVTEIELIIYNSTLFIYKFIGP